MPEPAAESGWEQRWHPLRREWVVYSAHRNTRPWQGAGEVPGGARTAYDPACYLCPGNRRIHGDVNPAYEQVFVFDNDHPVVGADAPPVQDNGPYRRRRADGISRVICYDPRHHVSISDLEAEQVGRVVQVWQDETRHLAARNAIQFILFFENRGEMVGVSNPHPHGQLYATNFVFNNIARELDAVQGHAAETGHNLFDDVLGHELETATRVVAENEHAVAFVPFFARYSYEVWVFPRKRHATLATLSEEEVDGLARIYLELSRRYDLLYGMPFPYVMSIYQAPVDTGDYRAYHLHLVFLPPLRAPGLRKFPAGPEIGGGNFMCDTLPEETAARLRVVEPDRYGVAS